MTLAALVVTLASSVGLAFDTGSILLERIEAGRIGGALEQALFILIVFGLLYGNLVFLLCRSGALRRRACLVPPARDALEQLFARKNPPSLMILVPSYKEEPDVIRQTLLSAALLRYPHKRVVLLIDNPPDARQPADRALLEETRALPACLAAELGQISARMRVERDAFQGRAAAGFLNEGAERSRLAELCAEAADVYEALAEREKGPGHADRFFRERLLLEPANEERARAERLTGSDNAEPVDFAAEYGRLAALFESEFTSFERKVHTSLSHAPNKAMNLNSYLALMGRRWKEVVQPDEAVALAPAGEGAADLEVPDADYVITLDADSLLLPDYALKLVAEMERPENARFAIMQTPYSAYPGAASAIERAAAATTDIMHEIHQGMTAWGATYWVGANALIRRRALDDIAVEEREGDRRVVKFIQDRTVIEDTESTVDLLHAGWRLHNHPERLAYSATPPDYGALLVQRRRWANGGLVILPKLLRLALRDLGRRGVVLRTLVQVHYLVSLALSSAGVLILMVHPFEGSMRSVWLPVTALPYFLLYGLDLRRIGYRWRDLPGVYALNLLLVPINIGGVLKSLEQIATGRQTAFARTPKVASRTAAPALYVIATAAIAVWCIAGAAFDAAAGRWAHAGFALSNAAVLTYAMARFVGFEAAVEDGLAWVPRRRAMIARLARLRVRRIERPVRMEGAFAPPAE